MYQHSLIILKPDSVQRSLIGTIIARFEQCGLTIHASKMQQVTPPQAKLHYHEHVDKSFYPTVEQYICSSPVMLLVIGGNNAIDKIRALVGATEPASASIGTIRGDFAHQAYASSEEEDTEPIRNLIHASANISDAKYEINLWFNDNEIINYNKISDQELSIKRN